MLACSKILWTMHCFYYYQWIHDLINTNVEMSKRKNKVNHGPVMVTGVTGVTGSENNVSGALRSSAGHN